MERSDLDPSTVAVLCVECQNGVLGDKAVLPALAADNAALLAALRGLVTGARAAGAKVVHATYEGSLAGKHVGTARIWRHLSAVTADWCTGHVDTMVLAELFDPADLVVARRHGLYPTLDTELIPILADLGIRTVVLAGVSLNLALPFTAGHLAQAGFDVLVSRDAVGGTPTTYGQDVLRHTMAFLGELVTVDELLSRLARG